MKNKLFKLAAVITLSVFLLAGAVIAAPGIIDFDYGGKKTVQSGQSEQPQPEEIHQSFSADLKETGKYGNAVQLPMIILIFGFTVIIAGVNYRLRDKE